MQFLLRSKFENLTKLNIPSFELETGFNNHGSKVIYNERFAGVIIKQNPGEGNRLHYHQMLIVLGYFRGKL